MIEGRLTIDLYRNGKGIERAEIASSRPPRIVSLFENKTPAEVAGTLPLVFNVCRIAQGRASAAAMEKAMGVPRCPTTEAARAALVLAETAREHLLRIALHWARFAGRECSSPCLQRINRILPDIQKTLFAGRAPFAIAARARLDRTAFDEAVASLQALIAKIVFGEPVGTFLARADGGALEAYARRGATIPARLVRKVIDNNWASVGDAGADFLLRLDEASLLKRLTGEDADGFTATPEWAGAPRETTALARRSTEPLIADLMADYGTGLLTRLAARLVDLVHIPGEMRAQAARFVETVAGEVDGGAAGRDGEGIAQVEAARGRLVHGVRLAKGRIGRYLILAPTEWNFHPAGAAARGLSRLTGASEAELTSQARLLIDAIDPCVGYELRVH